MSSRFTSRADRARAMAESGRIIRTETSYLVPSSKPGIWYEVAFDGAAITCGCEDSQKGGNRCYHQMAAAFEAEKAMSRA